MNLSVSEKLRFRVLVAIFLISWLAGVVVNVMDTTYEVSGKIRATSPQIYVAASLFGISLQLISSVGLLLFKRWSRLTFCAFWVFAVGYTLVYGEGSGRRLAAALTQVYLLSAGMILGVMFLDPGIRTVFESHDSSGEQN